MIIEEKNIQSIRADFPILQEKIYGKPLVYLDNAATTQKPTSVIKKIEEGYSKRNANIHRGVHYLSQMATEAHESSRKTIQTFINAKYSHEIIFTRGTTESINLVAFSFGETFLQQGDVVLISAMEHHSNIVPWQLLRERKGIELRVIPFLSNGELDMESYRAQLDSKVKLVALTHISNVLGTINPIKEVINIAHAQHIPVLIDGAQAIPHTTVDVVDLGVDFYVFSAHKIYGPTGIGVLYGKEKYLEKMKPYQGGGEMIKKVTFQHTSYSDLPFKFEAGTPDFIGSTAFAEAINYVQRIGIEHIAQYENQLLTYATKELSNSLEGLRIFGESTHKSSALSFLIGDIHHYDMGVLLDKLGVAVRTGHHCAQPIMDYFEIEGTLRASFSFYNTKEEIDTLVQAIVRISKML